MKCINGQVRKSADEICDSCKVDPCPTMEYLQECWHRDALHNEPGIYEVHIADCPMYQELLP